MFWLDLTLPSPAENLALDEALLDCAESGGLGETLRFWEPRECFVVVGYSNRISTEADVAFCSASGIPILRRCTGGGTVLQGPGVLNYSLILRADPASPCGTIHAANTFIMERNRQAVVKALQNGSRPQGLGAGVEVAGCSDLAASGKKFSGNAQRRRQKYLLFHGSFLLSADLARIADALRMPSKQPGYRAGRTHKDFLTNLSVPVTALKAAFKDVWQATKTLDTPIASSVSGALLERYQSHDWNHKFP